MLICAVTGGEVHILWIPQAIKITHKNNNKKTLFYKLSLESAIMYEKTPCTVHLNSLRGKWVPQPTKKGVLWEKNHISINFWTCMLGLGAKNSSRWYLQYSRVELACYTKCCCWKWLLKLADLFPKITQASQPAKWPCNRQKTDIFLAGLRTALQKKYCSLFFLNSTEKWSTDHVENTW